MNYVGLNYLVTPLKHERINHYKKNPLQSECDVCGRPFKNQQQLIKHRMTHLNPAERQET